MTRIIDTRHCSWLLWHPIILLLLLTIYNFILTTAAPLPETFSAEIYDEAVKNFLLHRRIDNERKLIEDQLEIRALAEARAREQYISSHYPIQPEYPDGVLDEMLPVPSAQQAPDKRLNYMTLCHFKLCNMGRKRQL